MAVVTGVDLGVSVELRYSDFIEAYLLPRTILLA